MAMTYSPKKDINEKLTAFFENSNHDLFKRSDQL